MGKIRLISGRSHPLLARKIARLLKIPLTPTEIKTLGTVTEAAGALKKEGAKEIILCATHGLLSGNACQKLEKCPASCVLLLDTVPLPSEKKLPKIKVLSLAPLLAKVIKRIHHGRSLGALFTWEEKEIVL